MPRKDKQQHGEKKRCLQWEKGKEGPSLEWGGKRPCIRERKGPMQVSKKEENSEKGRGSILGGKRGLQKGGTAANVRKKKTGFSAGKKGKERWDAY